MSTPISMQAPAAWPFLSPVVPNNATPSGKSYRANSDGTFSIDRLDVGTLLGYGFTLTTGGAGLVQGSNSLTLSTGTVGVYGDGTGTLNANGIVVSVPGYGGLSLQAAGPGASDDVFLEIVSSQASGSGSILAFVRSLGTVAAKLPITNGTTIGDLSFGGYDGTTSVANWDGCDVFVNAAENFDATHHATTFGIATVNLAEAYATRFQIDGHGNSQVLNGCLYIASGVTVAQLATAFGTPAVGMIARVTDSLNPTIGSTVASGGSAPALVWFNNTNWTVIGH